MRKYREVCTRFICFVLRAVSCDTNSAPFQFNEQQREHALYVLWLAGQTTEDRSTLEAWLHALAETLIDDPTDGVPRPSRPLICFSFVFGVDKIHASLPTPCQYTPIAAALAFGVRLLVLYTIYNEADKQGRTPWQERERFIQRLTTPNQFVFPALRRCAAVRVQGCVRPFSDTAYLIQTPSTCKEDRKEYADGRPRPLGRRTPGGIYLGAALHHIGQGSGVATPCSGINRVERNKGR